MFVCDFCNAPRPGWSFPADPFVLSQELLGVVSVDQVSLSGWAACDECKTLIDADDRTGLADRSLACFNRFRTVQDIHDDCEVMELLRMVHTGFWASKRGDAIAI